MDRMIKNLELTFTLTNGEVEVVVYEPESDASMCFNTLYSPDEHPEFDEKLCMEIYGWLSMWMDEMEDDGEDTPYRVLTPEEKEAARRILMTD